MANERKLRILIDSSGAKTGGKEVTKEMGKIISSAKIATKTFEDLKNAMKGLMSGGGSKAAASNKALKEQADILKGMDAHVKALTNATNSLAKYTVNQQAVLHESNKELRQSATNIKLKTKLEFDSLKASEQSTAEYLQQAEALYRQQKVTKSLIDSMKQRVDAEGKIAPIIVRATKEQEAHNKIIARTASLENTLNTVRDGSYGKMVAAEKALRDEKKAILESLNARTSEQKQLAASTKAREKLENTMYAEQARTEALKSEMGRQSVKIQEQRRLVEELARSKERLNMVNSREYAELVKTRKAIEDKNKQLREMDAQTRKSTLSVKGMQSAFSSLTTVLAGLSAYFSVEGLIRTADEYTNITNKLSSVTQGTVDVTLATRELLAISLDARSSLTSTMDVYSKMTRVNEDLGKSQQEVKEFTEAVSKSVAMSGATVQGAQGAIMQFAQAMSSNWATAAQELNSILEQTPALAYYMVKGINDVDGSLKLTTGTLKKFAEEGGLSAELVFKAFQKVLPQIREDFKSTNQTISSSLEGLKGSFTVAVGEMDKLAGTSKSLTESINSLSKSLPDLKEELLAATVALGGLVSGVVIGGLIFLMGTAAGAVLALGAALAGIAGLGTMAYLSFTKYSRETESVISSTDEMNKSLDKFNQNLAVMSSGKIVDSIETTSEKISELNGKLFNVASVVEDMNNSKLSFFYKIIGAISGGEALVKAYAEQIEALQKQLDSLRDQKPIALKIGFNEAYNKKQNFYSGLLDNKTFESEIKTFEANYNKLSTLIDEVEKARVAHNEGSSGERIGTLDDYSLKNYTYNFMRDFQLLKDLKDELNSESNGITGANYEYEKNIQNLNNLFTDQVKLVREIDRITKVDPKETDAKIDALLEEKDLIEAIYKKRKETRLFEEMFGVSGEDMASTFTNALLTKDWSSFGSMIGSSIGTALNNSITSSLTASGIAGASIWGAIGGSIATTVIGGILAGKKQTGSSTTVSLSGGGVSSYDETRYKSFFGSSKTFTSLLDTTTKQIDRSLSSSISTVNNSLAKMGGSLVVSFEDFNYSTTVGSGDFTTAMDNITNAYVEANLAYIEDFQKVNQTALDALQDLSSKMNSVQSSFLIGSNGSIASAAERYIQSQASQLQGSYQDAYRNAILERETLKATLTGKLTEFNKNPYMGSKESSQYDDYLSRQGVLKEGLDAIRGRINELDGVINESLSRLGTSLSEASAKFSDTVISTISSLEGIDSEGAKARLGELASNYETTFYSLAEQAERAASRAAIGLSDYADLGVNASMSLREFRDAFDSFVNSPAFSPEGYSRWLLASEAMTSLSKANEALAEATAEGAVNLSDEISKATNDAFSNILDWINKIQGTSADGYVSLQTAQAQFQTQLSLARSGNADALSTITQYADTVLEAAKRSVNTSEQFGNIKSSIISSVSNIPKFADGGYHSGGLRLVGENGPEIEYTGSSNIYNNSQMEKIFDVSELLAEVKEMKAVMRSGLFAVAKNTGKSTELMRRWEGDGLPAERVYA